MEEDIKIFRDFCIHEINRLCCAYDSDKFTVSDYMPLAKLCMARGLTFNARRGSEVSKLTLSHWVGVTEGRWKRASAIAKLDPVEKKLAERLILKGKRSVMGRMNLSPYYLQKKW